MMREVKNMHRIAKLLIGIRKSFLSDSSLESYLDVSRITGLSIDCISNMMRGAEKLEKLQLAKNTVLTKITIDYKLLDLVTNEFFHADSYQGFHEGGFNKAVEEIKRNILRDTPNIKVFFEKAAIESSESIVTVFYKDNQIADTYYQKKA